MKFDRKCLKLYAVTDRRWSINQTLYTQIEQALKGGVTLVQLREKDLDEEEFIKEAMDIKKLCHQYNVPLIINDNLKVAIESQADGIHIGQDDIEIEIVKKRFPHKIIGVTAHNLKEALEAQDKGADYLGIGAVFPTSTKTNTTPLSIEGIKEITNHISIPCVAIGGIEKSNINLLKDSGIDGVAVVSAIFKSDNIENTVKELLEELR